LEKEKTAGASPAVWSFIEIKLSQYKQQVRQEQ
jgi:hypothetical protein